MIMFVSFFFFNLTANETKYILKCATVALVQHAIIIMLETQRDVVTDHNIYYQYQRAVL